MAGSGRVTCPPGAGRRIAAAERFSIAIHGAALLYNFLLARVTSKRASPRVEDPVDKFCDDLEEWSQQVEALGALSSWNRSDMWDRVIARNPRIAQNVPRASVHRRVADAVVEGRASSVPEDRPLQDLVRHRERSVKGAQSRFTNDKLLRTWSGGSGNRQLSFRWTQVRRLLLDIHEGLGPTMLPPDPRLVLTDALRPPPGAVLERAVAPPLTLDLESAWWCRWHLPLTQSRRPTTRSPSWSRSAAAPIGSTSSARPATSRSLLSARTCMPSWRKWCIQYAAAARPAVPPQVWAVRFWDGANGAYLARLLVLSRNLTPDRCWDACLRLDGTVTTRRQRRTDRWPT